MKKWLQKIAYSFLLGYKPETTVSGIRIYVNGSGTTEIRDSKALLKIALKHFERMR